MLDAAGLTTRYGSISALRDASLTVGAGEIVGLVGPNGAGKTTLLNTLAGLLTPASGTVTLEGRDVTGSSPDAMLRAGVALVPEHRRLFANLTVEENLKIGGATATAAERAERSAEMAELFPVLKLKWSIAAGFLSGGEAQQLAIARALMSKPRLLMMDEPSLGLAPIIVDLVFDLIARLGAEGRTLLVVEQNATRMLGVADRAYVLRSGEVVATGTGAELLADTKLFDTFVGPGPEHPHVTSFIQNLVDLVFDLSARLGAEGRTLLVVEQNATRMLGVSDRAYVLRSGEVLATDTGAELLADTKLFDTKLFDTFVGPGPEHTT